MVGIDFRKFLGEDLAFRRRSEGSCRACSRHGTLTADILQKACSTDDLAFRSETVDIGTALVAA